MRKVLSVFALLLGGYAPAYAHAMLEHASPGAGATLAQAPKMVVLDFSEALEPAFSATNVSDVAGHDMTAAEVTVAGNRMSLALKVLAPGVYKVVWHAVSVDTHRTQGSYEFTVKP
jgi:methionine-rich copper-binding protein CopC